MKAPRVLRYASILLVTGAGVESTPSDSVCGSSDLAVGVLEKYDSFSVSNFSRYSVSLSNSTLSASESELLFLSGLSPFRNRLKNIIKPQTQPSLLFRPIFFSICSLSFVSISSSFSTMLSSTSYFSSGIVT